MMSFYVYNWNFNLDIFDWIIRIFFIELYFEFIYVIVLNIIIFDNFYDIKERSMVF